MIIYGTRAVKSTISTGNFHCPQCETQEEYRHRKARKFFTLYFIPIIPLNSLGEYVECRRCKSTFITEVLNQSNTASEQAFMTLYLHAIRHSMVLIMLADGIIEESEKTAVLNIINRHGHNDMTMADLEAYIVEVQRENKSITTYLSEVAPALNDYGKEMIIKSALEVAASDGHMDMSELQEISVMGQALNMDESHLKRILNEALPQQSS
ncbi:MAG: TerB family tellurite resistance protein [Bacteroidia bacterium]|nr:TerB family tellurite resistance protein [Bacteroidia bacterium]